MTNSLRRIALSASVVLLVVTSASAQDPPPSPLTARRTTPPPAVPAGTTSPTTRGLPVRGTVSVVVRLTAPAMIDVVDEDAVAAGSMASSRARRRVARDGARAQQARVVPQIQAAGGRVVSRLEKGLNALVVQVDATRASALRQLPDVLSVRALLDYEMAPQDEGGSGSLAQAAQYLGASASRAEGIDGTGVTIAVFDSGVDFTHKNLGGPGTAAFYTACTGSGANTAAPAGPCAAYFGPSAPKVIGGYDFVGETWQAAANPLAPDPNPIDAEGHGTHVADIAAGASADGAHQGIAPGAKLLAYKVCSAVSTACSSLALLQAVEAALDPNGDGDIDDAAQVWNFSLGLRYGQAEDDLTFELEQVARAGIVVVVAAGNDGDKPWVVAGPSTAPRVISVAQTALPDDRVQQVRVESPVIPELIDNTIKVTAIQPWAAPLTASITAVLVTPAQPLGCTAAAFAGFPAGAVALVDRGECNVSLKVANAKAAGAVAALIANNAAGLPPQFAYGGGDASIPALSISQVDGLILRFAFGPVTVTLDPANILPLTRTIVSTSSRGLAIDGARVKPDLGAPGAWLSAEAGTGETTAAFSGTSGAAPVVSGAAAILLDRYPTTTPSLVKRRLVNTAAPDVRTLDVFGNLYATPVSRVGSGELRIEPAIQATLLAGDAQNGDGNLSGGVANVTDISVVTRRLRLRNTSSSIRAVTLSPTFRDPAEGATGAVTFSGPSSVSVPPRSQVEVPVTLQIDGARLDPWAFVDPSGFGLAGLLGNNGILFDAPEVDGTLQISAADGERVQVGWHVLPRRASYMTNTKTSRLNRLGVGGFQVTNASLVQEGLMEIFALVGTSPKQARPDAGEPGSPGSNQAVVDLAAIGIRDMPAQNALQFAISTHGRRATPFVPGGFLVVVDTTRDGIADYLIENGPQNDDATDGRSIVNVTNVAGGTTTSYFYTDADFASGNLIFTVPLDALALGTGSVFDAEVYAYDNYFSGVESDRVSGITWTVGRPLYEVILGSTLTLPPNSQAVAAIQQTNSSASSQSGFLLQYRNNRDPEFGTVAVKR